jgi:hypothetical protein
MSTTHASIEMIEVEEFNLAPRIKVIGVAVARHRKRMIAQRAGVWSLNLR